jgi:hypothetical protein
MAVRLNDENKTSLFEGLVGTGKIISFALGVMLS